MTAYEPTTQQTHVNEKKNKMAAHLQVAAWKQRRLECSTAADQDMT